MYDGRRRRQWAKRTRNIINKNANRYGTTTDGAFFCFLSAVATLCPYALRRTQRQIANHFRTGLYFLALDSPPRRRRRLARTHAITPPFADEPPSDIYIRQLKNNVLRVFFFTPTTRIGGDMKRKSSINYFYFFFPRGPRVGRVAPKSIRDRRGFHRNKPE